MIPQPLDDLIRLMAKLPGVGRRSAQRAALALLSDPQKLTQLVGQLQQVGQSVKQCSQCNNLGLSDPCYICTDTNRNEQVLCVVESVADLWAMERSGAYKGRYFVLQGLLSAMEGRGPEDIGLPRLEEMARTQQPQEVILALSAGVDGQTTSHLIAHKLAPLGVNVTTLAKGLPLGAALDYMDEGTLSLAFEGRHGFKNS